MTELIPLTDAQLEKNLEVLRLKFQGETDMTIAKRLGMPRKDVVKVYDDWRSSSTVQSEMGDRVHELITELDASYEHLIRAQWEVVHSIDAHHDPSASLLTAKNAALKNIAEFKDRRIQVLQRSGVLDNQDLAADLAEMERQRDAIIDILDHDLCDKCQPKVARKIGELMAQAKPLLIVDGN